MTSRLFFILLKQGPSWKNSKSVLSRLEIQKSCFPHHKGFQPPKNQLLGSYLTRRLAPVRAAPEQDPKRPIPFLSNSILSSAISKTISRNFKLLSKSPVSHNTWLFRFQVSGNRKLSVPLGQHISTQYEFIFACYDIS